ncbi:SprT family protein [Bacillus tianshenii]|nr:SprT family protein [Bacillus tianshenii]
MNDAELQALTEEISETYFGLPFAHQAYFNHRLRTTGGRYMLRSHHIEINRKYLDEQGKEALVGIIKHELVHYHLHLAGKGYKHRDRDFKQLMKEVGAPRYCTPLSSAKKTTVYHFYTCKQCGLIYKRKRRINTAKYVCGKCKGKLQKTS